MSGFNHGKSPRGANLVQPGEFALVTGFDAAAYFLNASKSRSPFCAKCMIREASTCRRLASSAPMSEQARSSTAVKKAKSWESKEDAIIIVCPCPIGGISIALPPENEATLANSEIDL